MRTWVSFPLAGLERYCKRVPLPSKRSVALLLCFSLPLPLRSTYTVTNGVGNASRNALPPMSFPPLREALASQAALVLHALGGQLVLGPVVDDPAASISVQPAELLKAL